MSFTENEALRQETQGKVLFNLMLKSIGLAIMLFVLVCPVQNLVSALFALRYSIGTEVSLNYISYNVDAYSKKWNYNSVFMIYFGGPAFVFAFGLGAYITYRISWYLMKHTLSFVMSWVHLVCFFWFFADMVAGQILKKGTYIGFDYLLYLVGIDEQWHYVIGVFAFILLIITGAFASIRFLKAMPSIDLIVEYGNSLITSRLLVIPAFLTIFLLGTAAFLINGFQMKFFITLGLIAIPLIVSWLIANQFKEVLVTKYVQTDRPLLYLIGGVIVFVLALFVFGIGIQLEPSATANL